ncbi:MAG: hypothetical protein Q7R88_01820 [bacterium]|nr:hypothetical protein [bacterium]
MPLEFHTPLAPKKAASAASMANSGSHTFTVLGIGAILVAVVAVALSATLFFYKGYLVRSIGNMDEALVAARKSFEPEFVDAAGRLNARIESAKKLLVTHRALSPLFDLLENKTIENVRFTDFIFDASNERTPAVSMTGLAKSFNAVALQSDVFGSEPSFRDPVFANFTLNDRGEIVFNFKANVDPEFILYGKTLSGAADGEADSSAFEDELDEGDEFGE